AKAKGTGNGWALSILAQTAKYALGLTGTLFSGYSTSIFWIMHRMAPEVRRDFGFHEETRWARKFGLMKMSYYVDEPGKVQEDGSYTAGKQYFNRATERPGILPGIIGYALPRIVFASLQDVGLPLPKYSEEIIRLEMSAAQAEQYHDKADGAQYKPPISTSLYGWALEELKEKHNRGALSVWLNTALNRVDAMFRDETVTFNRRVSGKGKYAERVREEVMYLPAVEQNAPKDIWLANRCMSELSEGRKTLVFVRQTGKRDIQPHLKELLEAKGLRVGILKPSVSPRRRAGWITKHADKFDVLITNARLIKVGLNLRMFNTAIFYENEWSLAILWQAMKRIYRPGSPKPVRVLFPVYADTLEEYALDLVGKKMKAASLFYGDEVTSALTEEDDSDFLTEMVRSILKDEKIEKVDSIFATENMMTASPMGSPTAASPGIVPDMTMAEWLAEHGISDSRKVHRSRRRRRSSRVAENQIALLPL
ncbi:MAG: helicase-related protein, partial [Chloroflexota bacterium]|nr:helicase-related protein [Chloroflexota bacterium]